MVISSSNDLDNRIDLMLIYHWMAGAIKILFPNWVMSDLAWELFDTR
jgi:hypothetical protein